MNQIQIDTAYFHMKNKMFDVNTQQLPEGGCSKKLHIDETMLYEDYNDKMAS